MTDAKIEMLRHTLATLAYRAGKALRGAPPEFAGYGERTAGQILAHMCDLFDWALTLADGRQAWRDSSRRWRRLTGEWRAACRWPIIPNASSRGRWQMP